MQRPAPQPGALLFVRVRACASTYAEEEEEDDENVHDGQDGESEGRDDLHGERVMLYIHT